MSNISIEENDGNAFPTINQICPQCSEGNSQCLCIVDTTLPGLLNKINNKDGTNNLNNPGVFNQYCPNATCIQYNLVKGINEVVDCLNNKVLEKDKLSNYFSFNSIIFIICVIGVLFLLYFVN
jgi:hypothetical protein